MMTERERVSRNGYIGRYHDAREKLRPKVWFLFHHSRPPAPTQLFLSRPPSPLVYRLASSSPSPPPPFAVTSRLAYKPPIVHSHRHVHSTPPMSFFTRAAKTATLVAASAQVAQAYWLMAATNNLVQQRMDPIVRILPCFIYKPCCSLSPTL